VDPERPVMDRPDLIVVTLAALCLGAAAVPVVRAFSPQRGRSWAVPALVAGQTVLSGGFACFLPAPWAYLELILAWFLLVLALIDWLEMRLPDRLTVPLTGLGFLTALSVPGGDPVASGVGAIVGYGVFALTGTLYRRLRGQDGLGLGDAKLLAAVGAWLGWQALAPVVLISSLLALATLAVHRLATGRPHSAHEPFPFGPFLCCGFWLIWLLD